MSQVPLAKVRRVVAEPAQPLREERLVERDSEARPRVDRVLLRAVARGVAAGEQCGARRRALRCHVVARELGRARLQRGRPRHELELAEAHIIRDDQHDVWPPRSPIRRRGARLVRARAAARVRSALGRVVESALVRARRRKQQRDKCDAHVNGATGDSQATFETFKTAAARLRDQNLRGDYPACHGWRAAGGARVGVGIWDYSSRAITRSWRSNKATAPS